MREKRTERIDIRVMPSQKERWKAAAARDGLPLSEWIEWRLDENADAALDTSDEQIPKKREPSKPSVPSEELVDDLAALPAPIAPPQKRQTGLCPDCQRKGSASCPACKARTAKSFDTSKIFKRGE